MNRFPVLLLLICLFSTSAFSQTDSTILSPDEFEKAISRANAQVVDVRTPEEFKEGHIKNSTLANWNKRPQFVKGTKKLDRSKPVYLYCLKGVRSHAAAEYLRSQGFAQVYELNGGIAKWNEAGKPLEQ